MCVLHVFIQVINRDAPDLGYFVLTPVLRKLTLVRALHFYDTCISRFSKWILDIIILFTPSLEPEVEDSRDMWKVSKRELALCLTMQHSGVR